MSDTEALSKYLLNELIKKRKRQNVNDNYILKLI